MMKIEFLLLQSSGLLLQRGLELQFIGREHSCELEKRGGMERWNDWPNDEKKYSLNSLNT
jgi:hypothetical protein